MRGFLSVTHRVVVPGMGVNLHRHMCQTCRQGEPKDVSMGYGGHPACPATGKGVQVTTYNVLIMGASYGSLLATKLLFGGNSVKLVCLPAEVEAFNTEGAIVRIPIKGRSAPVEINSRKLPGHLSADGP